MQFYIVDAFTTVLFGGNPAGVVIVGEKENFPTDEDMKRTATELRYSETVFIKRNGIERNGTERIGTDRFQMRYFTPAAEVDLCGHATIGGFCALVDAGIIKAETESIVNTRSGDITVSLANGQVMMDMAVPRSLGMIDGVKELARLYKVMGLDWERHRPTSLKIELKIEPNTEPKIGTETPLKPEIISTGLPDIIMPVKDGKALQEIRPDFKALSKLSEEYGVVGVHAFCLEEGESRECTARCRNFAPLYDIDEEAATGTANGALTYYLAKRGMIEVGKENLFIQGEAMDRPSEIRTVIQKGEDGSSKIRVGGRAVILCKGEIRL